MLPVDAARQRPRPERVPRIAPRVEFPAGPLFCVIDGPTRGRAWSASSARIELHHLALKAGVRRRMAPHQYAGNMRYADAREDVLLTGRNRAGW